MKIFRMLPAAAVAATMFFSAASAATVTVDGTNVTKDCSLSNLTTSVACHGDFDGTDGNGGNVQASDLSGLFQLDGVPITNWMMIDKIGSVSGTNATLLSDDELFEFKTGADGTASGTWRFTDLFSPNAGSLYLFALKGGPDQAAYVLADVLSGDWFNFDLVNNGGQNAGLSNVRLFEAKFETSVIPLPAAGWLLLAGLGGLAAYGRKKRWA